MPDPVVPQPGRPEERLVDTTLTFSMENAAALTPEAGVTAEERDAISALPSGSALLVVRRGPNVGARFLLDSDITTAGRHPAARSSRRQGAQRPLTLEKPGRGRVSRSSGSGPSRLPESRAPISAMSRASSSKPNTSMFSRMRDGVTDFGMTT